MAPEYSVNPRTPGSDWKPAGLDQPLFDRETVTALLAKEERIKEKVQLLYERLDPYFRKWVDEQGNPGLCGREMNVVIAKDAMMLAERLGSIKALRDWEKNPERAVVPVHPDHTEGSLKLAIELAERKILGPRGAPSRSEPRYTEISNRPSSDAERAYSSLSPFFRAWVDVRQEGGLCSRELNTLIARDAMNLARAFGSVEEIERWAGKQSGSYQVRLPAGYSQVSLRTVVDLAKASVRRGDNEQ